MNHSARAPRTALPLLLLAATWLPACSTLEQLDWWDRDATPETAPLPEAPADPIPIRQLWRHGGPGGAGPLPQRMNLALVEETGHLYVSNAEGDLLALNASSGKQIWQRRLEVDAHAGPGADADLVVLGTTEGELLACAAEDGREVWRANLSGEILAPPKVGTGLVLTHTSDGKVFAHETGSGSALWTYETKVPALTLRGTSSPELSGQQVYTGLDSGRLIALQAGSGELLWELTVAAPEGRTELERLVDIDASPQARGGHVYVLTFQGRLAKIDNFRGGKTWEREFSSHTDFALGTEHLYVVDEKEVLWALDQVHGLVVWKQEALRGRSPSGPAVVGDYVVLGDTEGYLHWLRRADGTLAGRMRLARAPISAAPASSGEVVYARAENGTIGAYTAAPE